MTDIVGRQRCGRESAAHGSVRRERAAANANKPHRRRQRRVARNDDEIQPEPQYDDELQPEMNAMDAEFVLPAYAQPPVRRKDRRVSRYAEEVEPENEPQYVDEVEAEMNAMDAEMELVANDPHLRRRKGRRGGGSVAQIRHENESEHDSEDEMNDEMDHQSSPSPPRRNVRASRKVPNPARPEPPPDSYPGGPFDRSLLPNFGKHVAAAIWKGERTRKYLTCYNNGKKVINFNLPPRTLGWFWDVVDASGLGPLMKTNYGQVGYGLITAFTERWHSETGTFHLPIGEMTITLDDVSCLLHIPIHGKMLNHVTSTQYEILFPSVRTFVRFLYNNSETNFGSLSTTPVD